MVDHPTLPQPLTLPETTNEVKVDPKEIRAVADIIEGFLNGSPPSGYKTLKVTDVEKLLSEIDVRPGAFGSAIELKTIIVGLKKMYQDNVKAIADALTILFQALRRIALEYENTEDDNQVSVDIVQKEFTKVIGEFGQAVPPIPPPPSPLPPPPET